MSRPALTKTETNKSTDEDYESDESDIDRITTRLCDPKEDGDTLEELETVGKTVLKFGDSHCSSSVFLAETGEDGPLAAVYLTDGAHCKGQRSPTSQLK